MATSSQTMKSLRQQLAADFSDLLTGTVVTGTAGGTGTTGKITCNARALNDAPTGSLRGADLTVHFTATGLTETQVITANANASGVATVEVSTGGWATAPAVSDTFEITHLAGRGFRKSEYDNAIYQAIDALVDLDWTDLDSAAFAIEVGDGIDSSATNAARGFYRREYPLPTGYNGICGVDLLNCQPLTGVGTGAIAAFRNFGDVTARTRLGQGFQLEQPALVSYIAVYMGKVGTPTGNLTVVVETDSSDLPSTTAVTNGTSSAVAASTLSTRTRYVVFEFSPPIFLDEDTQYHLTLRRSDAVSASHYFVVGEDTTANYPDGNLSLYDGTWSAVTTSSLVFAVSESNGSWVTLGPKFWEYRNASSDQLLLKMPGWWTEGRVVRLRGGAPITRPTTEATTIPARPEWVATAAKRLLEVNKTGRASADNHGQAAQEMLRQAGIQPPPQRPYPANYIVVR